MRLPTLYLPKTFFDIKEITVCLYNNSLHLFCLTICVFVDILQSAFNDDDDDNNCNCTVDVADSDNNNNYMRCEGKGRGERVVFVS